MTTKNNILLKIRQHCLNCAGSTKEVETCTSGPDSGEYSSCVLWSFRFGTDPKPSKTRVERGKNISK